MKREITAKLLAWKVSPYRLPLVLCGARQVGKTYVLKDFGESHYDSCAYMNLMSKEAQKIFQGRYDAQRVLKDIGIFTKTNIVPGKTLIIIDEIQEVPEALTLMKDFKEHAGEYHVAAAGSYLGVSYHAGVSFPVGKVDLLDMHPLSFLEFVDSCGQAELGSVVRELDFERASLFAERLERLLRQYYFVGGMPEAVSRFFEGDEDYAGARAVQRNLLFEYDQDFSKHINDGRETERTRLVFDSIPAHLGRENHKFVFGRIAQGARSRDYETAIQWIADSGLALRVYRVDKPSIPLKFYRDLSAFKLYLHDVGLLGCAMEIEPRDVLLSNKGLLEYKGAMTEQYVCQQLVAASCSLYYWSASNATAEVDFIVKHKGVVAPIEVKAEQNLQAKSLRNLCEKAQLHGFRTSMSDYKEQDWMTNIPLWAVGAYFDVEAN